MPPKDRYPRDFIAGWPRVYHALTGPLPAQRDTWTKIQERALACFGETAPGQAKRTDGVILLGKTGRGKTALAAFLARLCDQKLHVTPHLVRCAELRLQLRGLPIEREVDLPELAEACRPAKAPLLVVDDVGVEKGVPDAEELVRALVDMRELEPCFTVWTSNLSYDEFVQHLGGSRQDSRLSPLKVLEFSTLPDFRKEQRNA